MIFLPFVSNEYESKYRCYVGDVTDVVDEYTHHLSCGPLPQNVLRRLKITSTYYSKCVSIYCLKYLLKLIMWNSVKPILVLIIAHYAAPIEWETLTKWFKV